MKQLSNLTVIRESVIFTVHNLGPLGKLLLVPFILQFCIFLIFMADPFSFRQEMALLPGYVMGIFYYLMDIVILSLWVPKWIKHYTHPKKEVHFFQLRKEERKFLDFFQFHAPERQFLWYSFVFGIILCGVFGIFLSLCHLIFLIPETSRLARFIGVAVRSFMGVGVITCLVVLPSRLHFLWPATALSKPMDFGKAWKQTRSQFKDLLIITSCFTLSLCALSLIIAFIIGAHTTDSALDFSLKALRNLIIDSSSPEIHISFKVLSTPIQAIYFIILTKFYQNFQKS